MDCGLWTVDCGLLWAAHAHAVLLLLLMPDGPACVMAIGIVPLSSNGVCPYIRTYIHIHSIHNQVYVWASEHFTHKHIHTRLTPAPSRSHSHQGSPPRRHPSNKKAPHRHRDRALDERPSSADFDPSRLAPPPKGPPEPHLRLASHTLHSPSPSTRAARARHPDQ